MFYEPDDDIDYQFSDNDNDNDFLYDDCDNDYTDYCIDNNETESLTTTGESNNSLEYIIDMDFNDSNILPIKKTPDISNPKLSKIENSKNKSIKSLQADNIQNTSNNINKENNDDDKEIKEIKVIKKYNIKKKVNLVNKDNKLVTVDIQNDNPVINKEKTKKNVDGKEKDSGKEDNKIADKIDNHLEINDETINFYSKDLDFKKVCCKKSLCKNDTGILCLLLKIGIFKEYRCNIVKCKIGKTWNGKPIQLILNRKNNVQNDLTPNNLELLCPNCYMTLHGLELFKKTIDHTIYKCKLCDYPLSNFKGNKKKAGYCMACESKIINSLYMNNRGEYLKQLNQTIDKDSPLNKSNDNFKTTNYYNEVSQFKKFNYDTNNINTDTNNINTDTNNIDTDTNNINTDNNKLKLSYDNKPIINLNMTVPDIDELIKEDN